jgi:chromosome segregation ATPase
VFEIVDGAVKRDEVKAFLKRLEERKTALETEASELKDYVKIDRIRRAIEYTLNEREIENAKMQVEQV